MSDFIAIANDTLSGLTTMSARCQLSSGHARAVQATLADVKQRVEETYRALLPQCESLRFAVQQERDRLALRYKEMHSRIKSFDMLLEGLEKKTRDDSALLQAELQKLRGDYERIEADVKAEQARTRAAMHQDAEQRQEMLASPAAAMLQAAELAGVNLSQAGSQGVLSLQAIHQHSLTTVQRSLAEVQNSVKEMEPLLSTVTKSVQQDVLEMVQRVEDLLADAGRHLQQAHSEMVDRPVESLQGLAQDVPSLNDSLHQLEAKLQSATSGIQKATKDSGAVFEAIRQILRKVTDIVTRVQNIQRQRPA